MLTIILLLAQLAPVAPRSLQISAYKPLCDYAQNGVCIAWYLPNGAQCFFTTLRTYNVRNFLVRITTQQGMYDGTEQRFDVGQSCLGGTVRAGWFFKGGVPGTRYWATVVTEGWDVGEGVPQSDPSNEVTFVYPSQEVYQ